MKWFVLFIVCLPSLTMAKTSLKTDCEVWLYGKGWPDTSETVRLATLKGSGFDETVSIDMDIYSLHADAYYDEQSDSYSFIVKLVIGSKASNPKINKMNVEGFGFKDGKSVLLRGEEFMSWSYRSRVVTAVNYNCKLEKQ